MSSLWWDCSAGAAGDMLLASLIDAGADRAAVEAAVRQVVPEVSLEITEVRRGALRGSKLTVRAPAEDHPHRPWSQIRSAIAQANLPPSVREGAHAVYSRLAAAEASIHGIDVETVELHEVGAADSVADIVGTVVALDLLGVDQITATPLPMASGTAHTAHGQIPLPAPATLAVLHGWPVVSCIIPGEWVTPTGAALLSTLASPGDVPAMVIGKVGHGAGTLDPSHRPNIVRALLGQPAQAANVVSIACNLDDMTSENLALAHAQVLEAGALDAWITPTLMKKGRPGFVFTVLAQPDNADHLSTWLLRNTTTLGIRRITAQREVLQRWTESRETAYGTIRTKMAGRDGEVWKEKPEHDDVVAAVLRLKEQLKKRS